MTVKELIDVLMNEPLDRNVKVVVNRRISDLEKISCGVEMETNIVSIWLMGAEEGE